MASLNMFIVACAIVAGPLLATAAPQEVTASVRPSTSGASAADVEATLGHVRDSRRLLQRKRNRRNGGNSNGGGTDAISTFVEQVVDDEDVSGSSATTPSQDESAEEPAEEPEETTEIETTETSTSPATSVGGSKEGHGTHFAAMGTPFGGCGVPPAKAVDDNGKALPFVALNTNSEFSSGSNCGRWVEITMGANCVGGGNDVWSICNGGSWEDDDETGKTIYGYTMDSCADENYWCQNDANHLDFSEPYLDTMGYVGEKFNGRMISWSYMSGTPDGWSMNEPKFMFKDGSGEYFASLIVYNVDDGFSTLEQQLSDGTWQEIHHEQPLGNQFFLEPPFESTVTVRITGATGTDYGTFEVNYPCAGGCADNTDTTATKL